MKRTPAVSLVLALLCVLPVNAEDYYNETALPDGSRIVCTEHQMIPAPYHTAYRFDKYGVLAPDGTFLVEPIYQSIAAPVEGRALFFKAGEGYGYFDENWNVVIPAQYRTAKNFSEGLAAVSDEHWMIGYIDRSGNTVVPFQYTLGGKFTNGKAYV
ncbi:MAG: WG repeat-containing protein, partial [Kiritimatiellae bacterium]|nr:WG repeat-containing protein [Kiritimatiellia bacterium]